MNPRGLKPAKFDLRPINRAGIATGEVIVADRTATGAGVVQAQRVEQLAGPGGICVTAAICEALSKRMRFDLEISVRKHWKGLIALCGFIELS